MKTVICLSGGIASGKTTVAQALAKHFRSVAVRSFGEVVRRRARSQGKPLDRPTLQTLGLELIDAGWQGFIDALLEDIPQSVSVLIVDGIRHLEAVEELQRRRMADRFLTVYLKVEHRVQEDRLQKRGEPPATLGHAVETSFPEIEARADLVINAALPLAEVEQRILDTLHS